MTKLLITLDVDTDKPKARAVTVSAARPGELPVIRTCAFSERHQALDALYVEALKRKPAVVKKPKGEAKAEEPKAEEAAEEKPDQLVRPEMPAAEAPTIAGDAAPEQPALLEIGND